MKSSFSLLLPIFLVATALVLVIGGFVPRPFVSATYINGVGYNLIRPELVIPKQPHDIQYPQQDTTSIAPRKVRESAIVCDAIAPVMRAVQCEIHLFDECGNPVGNELNVTQGWDVAVEELRNPGTFNHLVAPIIWLERGVGRFYFTPVHHGHHRVTLIRKPRTYNKGFLNSDLRVTGGVGAAGFTVWVRDSVIKGMTNTIGQTNKAVQRMLWTLASHNAQVAGFPPAMPATTTFQDKEHRFDDRRFAELQEDVRRPMVQPEAFPTMPQVPAYYDDNNFRLVDYARP